MKTKIVICSNSGLTKKDAQKRGWGFIPIIVTDGVAEELDGVTIDYNWTVNKLREKVILKTAQPSPLFVEELMKEVLKDADQAIFFLISSKLSGTYDSFLLESKKYPNTVRVVDTRAAAWIETMQADKVQNAIKNGVTSLDDLVKIAHDYRSKTHVTLVPADLKTLRRGGRISAAAALMGNLAKIKPILEINQDGIIDKLDKARSLKKAYKIALEDHAKKGMNKISIVAFDVVNGELDIAKEVLQEFNFEVNHDIVNFSTAVAAHVGPGTIGFIGESE